MTYKQHINIYLCTQIQKLIISNKINSVVASVASYGKIYKRAMQTVKTIFIRQPFYLKPLSAIKRAIRKLSLIKNTPKLERVGDTWFGLEQAVDVPFRWSHPIAKLNIQNLSKLTIRVTDPLGRDLHISTKEVMTTVKLNPGETYDIVLSVCDAEDVVLRCDPFNPDSDTRCLGMQYLFITTQQCLVLN
jgi:hypothetical protein